MLLPLRLTESATILRYLAGLVDSATYPTEPRARARVDEALDWFNTGFYRDHGYGLVYPQILPHYAALAGADSLAFHAGRAAQRLEVLDRHMIGDRAFVAGDIVSIADYFGVGLVTLGELIRCDFTPYPNVVRWYRTMCGRPNWRSANAGLQTWANFARGPAYVTV